MIVKNTDISNNNYKQFIRYIILEQEKIIDIKKNDIDIDITKYIYKYVIVVNNVNILILNNIILTSSKIQLLTTIGISRIHSNEEIITYNPCDKFLINCLWIWFKCNDKYNFIKYVENWLILKDTNLYNYTIYTNFIDSDDLINYLVDTNCDFTKINNFIQNVDIKYYNETIFYINSMVDDYKLQYLQDILLSNTRYSVIFKTDILRVYLLKSGKYNLYLDVNDIQYHTSIDLLLKYYYNSDKIIFGNHDMTKKGVSNFFIFIGKMYNFNVDNYFNDLHNLLFLTDENLFKIVKKQILYNINEKFCHYNYFDEYLEIAKFNTNEKITEEKYKVIIKDKYSHLIEDIILFFIDKKFNNKHNMSALKIISKVLLNSINICLSKPLELNETEEFINELIINKIFIHHQKIIMNYTNIANYYINNNIKFDCIYNCQDKHSKDILNYIIHHNNNTSISS